MLFLIVTGVLFFTANVVATSRNCSADGTFCLQVNMDSSYSYQVPSGINGSDELAMSFVIERFLPVGKFYSHRWIVEIGNHFRELETGTISFIPERAPNGQLMLAFMTNDSLIQDFVCYKWIGVNWQITDCRAFFQRFYLQVRTTRFSSTHRFDEFVGFESQKMRVQVDMTYLNESESKQISIQTKEAIRLFTPKDFVATAPSASGITPTSANVTPEHEDKPKKGGVDPFIIAGLVSLICVLVIAVAVVSYLICKPVQRKSPLGRWRRGSVH